jgi:hypothetical protein
MARKTRYGQTVEGLMTAKMLMERLAWVERKRYGFWVGQGRPSLHGIRVWIGESRVKVDTKNGPTPGWTVTYDKAFADVRDDELLAAIMASRRSEQNATTASVPGPIQNK